MENRLLAVLPKQEYLQLQPHLNYVTLQQGEMLYEPGAIIRQVYFPATAFISLQMAAEDASPIEISMVGREGAVGLSIVLEENKFPFQARVQLAGGAYSIDAAILKREFEQQGTLQKVLLRYIHLVLVQVSRTGICHQFHPVLQRFSRLLLQAHDHAQAGNLPLTQEYLARTLGVRRASIGEAASSLQDAGLISYARGQIVILDRPRLEATTCSCYRAVKELISDFTQD